jgi:tyrosyl-tRNA synthetase
MAQTINTDPQKIEEILTRGVANVYNKDELRKKLESGKQLHIKFGTDVTGPDLTLGHAVMHRKIRDFQELGHRVTLIVGDFTTLVGDHSDKMEMRKETNEEEIARLEANYQEQFFKTILRENVEIRHNSEWLKKLDFRDVLELTQQFTVSQMMDRETTRLRYEQGNPIGLDEFLYPLMQGYDSVALNCDVELGATEQTFNLLAGRRLMEHFGQTPQSCVAMRLLVGNDGRKMGKSLGNYISIKADANEMFSKLMAIVDEVIVEYFELITRVPMDEVRGIAEAIQNGENPMSYKKMLAFEVTRFYHGEEAAQAAQAEFERVVQNKDYSAIAEEHILKVPMNVIELLLELNFAPSKSEARRLIDQSAVRLNDEAITSYDALIGDSGIFKVGKKRIIKLVHSK